MVSGNCVLWWPTYLGQAICGQVALINSVIFTRPDCIRMTRPLPNASLQPLVHSPSEMVSIRTSNAHSRKIHREAGLFSIPSAFLTVSQEKSKVSVSLVYCGYMSGIHAHGITAGSSRATPVTSKRCSSFPSRSPWQSCGGPAHTRIGSRHQPSILVIRDTSRSVLRKSSKTRHSVRGCCSVGIWHASWVNE